MIYADTYLKRDIIKKENDWEFGIVHKTDADCENCLFDDSRLLKIEQEDADRSKLLMNSILIEACVMNIAVGKEIPIPINEDVLKSTILKTEWGNRYYMIPYLMNAMKKLSIYDIDTYKRITKKKRIILQF